MKLNLSDQSDLSFVESADACSKLEDIKRLDVVNIDNSNDKFKTWIERVAPRTVKQFNFEGQGEEDMVVDMESYIEEIAQVCKGTTEKSFL